MYFYRLLYVVLFSVFVKNGYGIKPYFQQLQLPSAYSKLRMINMDYQEKCPIFKINLDKTLTPTVELQNAVVDCKFNIKCGISNIVLSFMHLIALILNRIEDTRSLFDTLDKISTFSKYISQMLAVLYHIDFVDTFDIWLVLVYTSNLPTYGIETSYYFLNFPSNTNLQNHIWLLMGIHETVNDQLLRSMSACSRQSKFCFTNPNSYFYEKYSKLNDADSMFDAVMDLYNDYAENVKRLMARTPSFMTSHYNEESFNVNKLYLNSLGSPIHSLALLQEGFVENKNLSEMIEKIRVIYQSAMSSSTLLNGLMEIHKYHALFQNMLKTIMLSMLWTHILLVEDNAKAEIDQTMAYVELLNGAMTEVLTTFVTVAGLKDDGFLNELIDNFGAEVSIFVAKANEMAGNIKNHLLINIAPDFECDVTEHLVGPVDKESLFRICRNMQKFGLREQLTMEVHDWFDENIEVIVLYKTTDPGSRQHRNNANTMFCTNILNGRILINFLFLITEYYLGLQSLSPVRQ